MIPVRGYAALSAASPLQPFDFERRDAGGGDVVIDIAYCGVCHSDLHYVDNHWGLSMYPIVPGHEIVGTVAQIGSEVSRFRIGEPVGVGCMVDSCRVCPACVDAEEQFCDQFPIMTYNSYEKDGTTPTYGGYSSRIVVDQNYVLKVSDRLSAPAAAPLLCAGITAYSPLRHWHVGTDSRVGVIGLGGIGHMAVKLAAAMGADVTVFSHSQRKQADASRFGATNFVDTSERELTAMSARFDLILNTASNSVDVNPYINLLARDGTLVLLGAAESELSFFSPMLYPGRRSLSASMIGGIHETQEMLDFCSTHNIGADIELFAMAQLNEAYERVAKGDIAYRAVLDLATIDSGKR